MTREAWTAQRAVSALKTASAAQCGLLFHYVTERFSPAALLLAFVLPHSCFIFQASPAERSNQLLNITFWRCSSSSTFITERSVLKAVSVTFSCCWVISVTLCIRLIQSLLGQLSWQMCVFLFHTNDKIGKYINKNVTQVSRKWFTWAGNTAESCKDSFSHSQKRRLDVTDRARPDALSLTLRFNLMANDHHQRVFIR